MKGFILCILFIGSGIYLGHAQVLFVFDDSCAKAYDEILHLQTQRAYATLQNTKAGPSSNLMVEYLLDYLSILPVILDEDETAYKTARKERDKRIRYFRKLDVESPWRLYCIGEIYLRWAIADYKMGHEWKAALSLIRSYDHLSENADRFPDFILHYKGLGLIQALMGSLPIPDYLKWTAAKMSGIKPSVEGGYSLVSSLYEKASIETLPFEEEIRVAMIYLDLHLRERGDLAWKRCQDLGIHPEESALASFVMANVAMRTGRNDEAIEILQAWPKDGQKPFPYLDFMLGEAKMHRLDSDADIPFRRFLSSSHGGSFRKSAFERLYWHKVLFDGIDQERWRDRMEAEGNSTTDADREAAFQRAFKEEPHPQLLKARLLFDGAYYIRAKEEMKSIKGEGLSSEKYLEYRYRNGRIDHKLENFEDALTQYKEVIKLGAALPDYYACNAALQSGLIMEERQEPMMAKQYFELCLDLHPAGYVRSLHMKARAGLSRIKSIELIN